MTRKNFLGMAGASLLIGPRAAPAASTLEPERFRHYIDEFNGMAKEEVVNYVPDARAWDFLKDNIPLFTCPDNDFETTYYFRWWTYRKHIKQTPAGFIVTEFLKPVNHAGEFNALSCAFGHHLAEGRWLHDRRFLDDYVRFWLRTGPSGGLRANFHQFSGWAAAALYGRWLVDGNREWLTSWLAALLEDYRAWERERLTESGLFWQRDVSDGMEESISGGRSVKNLRPSINSYMFGNATAISAIAAMAGDRDAEREYRGKAARLKTLVEQRLWNKDAHFFETLLESGRSADVRESIGFTPWYFDLPEHRAGYEIAWKQLMDPQGFYAPFGPATAERRHPKFQIADRGDDCQWNGPSWPFATTIALRALANVLNRYPQNAIGRRDYFRTLQIYTRSQRLKLESGRVIPWIDENLDPFTGEWHARARKIAKGTFYGRGDYYNHSGYADLAITGLAGLRPRADNIVEVNPLAPAEWDWFCLDRVRYRGRMLTIAWDRSGAKFGGGKGLRVFADGKQIAAAPDVRRITGPLG